MLWGWVSEGVFGDIEWVEKELVKKSWWCVLVEIDLFFGVGAGGECWWVYLFWN